MRRENFLFAIIPVLISILLSSCAKHENLTNLLGPDFKSVRLEYSYDFTGVSTHGEKFLYKEYVLDRRALDNLININGLANMPKILFVTSRRDSKTLFYYQWQKKPIHGPAYGYIASILDSSRFQGDSHVKKMLAFNDSDSKYISYICTYPEGNYIFVLNPSNNRLLIIEKRG